MCESRSAGTGLENVLNKRDAVWLTAKVQGLPVEVRLFPFRNLAPARLTNKPGNTVPAIVSGGRSKFERNCMRICSDGKRDDRREWTKRWKCVDGKCLGYE